MSAPEECRSVVSPEEYRVAEEGQCPVALTIPDDAEARKGLLLPWEKTDTNKLLASMKDTEFEGI